ncbi:MAG: ATP-binding cassette domain-containing protein, partial [Bacteroidota bacterium]
LIYQKYAASKRKKRIKELLDRLQMRPKQHHFPAQLSGGQQQKIAICRAIAGDPDLILADEPTGNLDSQQGQEVMELLQESHHKGSSIIMVTHSSRDAEYAQRKIELKDGFLKDEVISKPDNSSQA